MSGRVRLPRGGRTEADRATADARAEADEALGVSAGLRWPWALLAAVLGAAGGAALALIVRRQLRSDPPGAQEPHEVQAVVDRPAQEPPA